MKVVCEIPLNAKSFEQSEFNWIQQQQQQQQQQQTRGDHEHENRIFVLEDGKRLRLFRLQADERQQQAAGPVREIQSATLAEPRVCSHFSWNRDASVLAIVVDKKQIYFWHLSTNTFSQFKCVNSNEDDVAPAASRRGQSGEHNNLRRQQIELIGWSRRTDRLAICYSSGQILLCRLSISASSCLTTESRFVDNSDSVLKRIVAIEVSEFVDLLACVSVISELLVMTFDGQTKFYLQCDGLSLFNLKFSPPAKEASGRRSAGADRYVWLAYQSRGDGLSLKKVQLSYAAGASNHHDQMETGDFQDSKPELNIVRDDLAPGSYLLDFHWLDSHSLIACFSSGSINVLRLVGKQPSDALKRLLSADQQQQLAPHRHPSVAVNELEKFSIAADGRADDKSSNLDFKLIECKRQASGESSAFALMATTSNQLFYYQLHEAATAKSNKQFRLEQIDSVDLSSSLDKLQLQIERLLWNAECSLVAIQLTSGHILVYRARLELHLLASCGSRAAFTSSSSEITILNYANTKGETLTGEGEESTSSSDEASDTANQDALIMNVNFKPSALAVGPKHLALALNNRVRFYSLTNNQPDQQQFSEQEFLSIATELSLNTEFVAVLFEDGRLKLQAIPSIGITADSSDYNDNERFFPDPLRPETITCFLLTQDLLVYCTREQRVVQFSLTNWQTVQICQHANQFKAPIRKMRANEYGNKFICLVEDQDSTSTNEQELEPSANVYLLDLYSNELLPLIDEKHCLINRLFKCQLNEVIKIVPDELGTIDLQRLTSKSLAAFKSMSLPSVELTQVQDAIWDSDGRSVLLVERESVHVFAVLNHTLEREQPVVVYVGSTAKPTNYKILYASQGIVSYQTILGKVINSILETHNDDLRLSQLEGAIEQLRMKCNSAESKSTDGQEEVKDEAAKIDGYLRAQFECQCLKLNYLSSILPICSLIKSHEICKHSMNDDQFNIVDEQLRQTNARYRQSLQLINETIWRQLGAWAIFCSNLDFALMVFAEHGLQAHVKLLGDLMRSTDSREEMKSRLLELFAYE